MITIEQVEKLAKSKGFEFFDAYTHNEHRYYFVVAPSGASGVVRSLRGAKRMIDIRSKQPMYGADQRPTFTEL